MKILNVLKDRYFLKTNEIVCLQDNIKKDILSGKNIDYKKSINSIKDQAYVCLRLWGLNAVYYNNISIRNHLLLAVLYYKNGELTNSEKELSKAKYFIKYNLIDDCEWSEGPGYFLYTIEMVDLYLTVIFQDTFLVTVKEKGLAWLEKFKSPDGFLPPIGDTTRTFYKTYYPSSENIIKGKEQTILKNDRIWIMVRHPSSFYLYKFNGHIHFDFGNIVVYNKNLPVVYPVGYPGYQKKMDSKLYDLRNENSIYIDKQKEPWWRLKYYRLISVVTDENCIKVEYSFNGRYVSRLVILNDDTIRIIDNGSDGINLNIDIFNCFVNVNKGENKSLKTGYHAENGKILTNFRIFVPDIDTKTDVSLRIK